MTLENTDSTQHVENTARAFSRKLLRVLRHSELYNIMPDEKMIDNIYPECGLRFRIFTILYCFYFFPEKSERIHIKYKIPFSEVKYLFEKVLDRKVEEELKRLRELELLERFKS